jgi:hypothetical protein
VLEALSLRWPDWALSLSWTAHGGRLGDVMGAARKCEMAFRIRNVKCAVLSCKSAKVGETRTQRSRGSETNDLTFYIMFDKACGKYYTGVNGKSKAATVPLLQAVHITGQ